MLIALFLNNNNEFETQKDFAATSPTNYETHFLLCCHTNNKNEFLLNRTDNILCILKEYRKPKMSIKNGRSVSSYVIIDHKIIHVRFILNACSVVRISYTEELVNATGLHGTWIENVL